MHYFLGKINRFIEMKIINIAQPGQVFGAKINRTLFSGLNLNSKAL